MDDLEITVDPTLPPHAIYLTHDGHTVRVTVSPDVEAKALGALRQDIAQAIADAIDPGRQ